MSYDRRATNSSQYTPLMSDLVQVVDGFTDAAKGVKKAQSIMKKLEGLFKKEDITPERLYGLNQYMGYLRDSFEKIEAAVKDLEETYDHANNFLLEKNLK